MVQTSPLSALRTVFRHHWKEPPAFPASFSIFIIPSLWQPLICFSVYEFAASEHFIWMESYCMWPFMTGSFHWALCFQGVTHAVAGISPSFPFRTECHSVMWMNPHWASIHQSTDMGLFPLFEQCCCEQLWTRYCINMCLFFLNM